MTTYTCIGGPMDGQEYDATELLRTRTDWPINAAPSKPISRDIALYTVDFASKRLVYAGPDIPLQPDAKVCAPNHTIDRKSLS